MLRNKLNRSIYVLAALAMAVVVAKAGGPLYIFDTQTKKPYWWSTASPVRVYTDSGPFEVLPAEVPPETTLVTNEKADSVMAFALAQWSNVPTTSFRASIVGDFESVGLGDVNDGPSAEAVLNTDNGGGIHVVYDADGQVMEQYFGIPAWAGVLGIASPEWANETTGEITEGWVVINSTSRFYLDNELEQYAGVFTHEFGHSINLAHSQANGSIDIYWEGGPAGPKHCTDLPYAYENLTKNIETMYPFIDPYAYPDFGTPSGKDQATVDISDDKTAISNLYPAPGYARSTGTISGKVTLGNGRKSGFTGINVIARNVNDPYGDVVSAMTGEYTRGEQGNDGTFALRGLRPGARYVVYFNSIVSGGFSTPQPYHVPSPEEFFNGRRESGNGLTDSPCEYSSVTAGRGDSKNADLEMNQVAGAPTFLPIGPGLVPNSITSDGRTVGGGSSAGVPFKWTERDGAIAISDPAAGVYGSTGFMSRDGRAFSGDTYHAEDGYSRATLFKANTAPRVLPVPEGGEPCDLLTNNYGVAANGKAVAGMVWIKNCRARPFIWTPQRGSVQLPVPEGTNSARPNNISDDGSTVFGWFEDSVTYWRQSAVWKNGQFSTLSTPEMPVGEVFNSTPDGSTLVGLDAGNWPDVQAWYWNRREGLVRIGRLQPEDIATANAISDDGKVIAGVGGADMPIFWGGRRAAFLWTKKLGMVDLEHFLQSQGTYLDDWMLNAPLAMSADGTVITGYGFGPRASGGWVIKLDKVNMCHAERWNHRRTSTVNVSFPEGMNSHLAHGDTVGVCTDER